MARSSEAHKLALTIMDFLYFHDIAFLVSFSDAKNIFYSDLLSYLEEINLVRKYKGQRAELYKHYLLCAVEIFMGTSHDLEGSEDIDYTELSNELLDAIVADILKHNFSVADFNFDFIGLIEELKLTDLPRSVGYKLVSQILAFECYGISISTHVLTKFLGMNILEVKKYQPKNNCLTKELVDSVFYRAMLFVEFEISKKQKYIKSTYKFLQMSIDFSKDIKEIEGICAFVVSIKKTALLIKTDYTSIAERNFETQFNAYLKDIVSRLGHQNLFFNDVASCMSYLGVWFLLYHKETNLKKPLHQEPPNHDLKDSLKNTCADEARKEMLGYGFAFTTSRTFNNHYNNFFDSYARIRDYFISFSNDNIGILTPDLVSYFFLVQLKNSKLP